MEDKETPSRPKASSYRLANIRPHSANRVKKSSTSEAPVIPPLDLNDSPRRPWTAQGNVRSTMSSKRVMRQTLKRSHLKTPTKLQATPITSPVPASDVSPGEQKSDRPVGYPPMKYIISAKEEVTPKTLDQGIITLMSDGSSRPKTPKEGWAITSVPEEEEKEPDSSDRKRHPSFETWLAGSPHESDEYDTDLEADVKKTLKEEEERKRKKKTPKKRTLKEDDKPVDPTGTSVYHDQCRKQGVIPVSYLCRHLGNRSLRMRHHYLGGEGAKPVAKALLFNTVTENLDLGDNYLEADGAVYLANMLKENTFIVSLDISNNFIQSNGAAAVADMLEVNTTLKTLNLSGNQLKDTDIRLFIDAIATNISLVSLDLSNNDIGELGGTYIGMALEKNECLNDLDLSWNSIRGKGAMMMANALIKNKTLEVLDVSWNGFGVQGADAFQQSLKLNTKLRVLDLSNNRISKAAAKSFSIGLSKNFGLETLLMNLNPMGDEGIEAVLQAVSNHQTLHYVALEEMNLSPSSVKKITELESEKEVTILHGGVGGYQRFTTQTSVLRLLSKFLRERRSNLTEAFALQDKGKSGTLSTEETKSALREAGLRLTNRQMCMLLDEIDHCHTGSISYQDILSGKTLGEYYRRKPSQAFTTATTYGNNPQLLSNMGRQMTVA